MTPEDIEMIRRVLPEETLFPYYPDRESPWLLAQGIPATATVSALKAGPSAALLNRPLVKPVVAASGGTIRQADLLAVAHADRALRLPAPGKGARDALNLAYSGLWEDYLLSFTEWGTRGRWQYQQLSRKGGNLVVQVGFPSDHAAILGRTLRRIDRSHFEFYGHPVRQHGRQTLDWVRLDIDIGSGTALIEEVQSDWLREVADAAGYEETCAPQSRQSRVLRRYEEVLSRRYSRCWPTVALLAALMLLADELGVRSVWMHGPEAGAALKHISGRQPPRSLYTQLPKRFGFQPVREAPPFLQRPRRRTLSILDKRPEPQFWRLDLRP